MATVAHQGGLVPDGLKINLLPRTTHFRELLLISQNCVQGLSDLIDVQESH